MINDIIEGIAAALNEKFGADYPIYMENVPQGFKEPCFSIVHILGEDEPYLTGRRLRKHKFDIHFFPKLDHKENTQMYSVERQLYSALEYINVLDILFRGTKMSSERVDGVLHFFVNYDKFIGEEEVEYPHMETLITEE